MSIFATLRDLTKNFRDNKQNNVINLNETEMAKKEECANARREDGKKMTVAEVASLWYKLKENALTPSMRNNYRLWINKMIAPFFRDCTSIRKEAIETFVRQMRTCGYTPDSVRSMVYVNYRQSKDLAAS